MKCIYCNAEKELTSSDIITSAITGAKLTKSFVCHKHNAFTNDKYEKRFSADLDFLRNNLGLSTRDGNAIQYKADLLADGKEILNIKVSDRKSLYKPKGVISGTNENGKKVLIAPENKISNGKHTQIDLSNATLRKELSSDYFIGFYALHSVAKIAYEWYCYINNIEEFNENYHEIVDYILGNNNNNLVEIINNEMYYVSMDYLSEPGANSCFQYDDRDGCRYVAFTLWNVITYRVKICESQNAVPLENQLKLTFHIYHIDGTKSSFCIRVYPENEEEKLELQTIQTQNITNEIWELFVKRIENIISTVVISIHSLKKEVDTLTFKLKKYDEGNIDICQLFDFGENVVIATINTIDKLYTNKENYDPSKSFSQNIKIFLNLDSNNVKIVEPKEKRNFIANWIEMDEDKTLSDYLWKRINTLMI